MGYEPRDCRVCGSSFKPQQHSQRVCGMSCKYKLPRQKPVHASKRNKKWASNGRRGKMIGLLTATEFNLLDALSVLDGVANKADLAAATGMTQETARRAMFRCREVGLVREVVEGSRNTRTSNVYYSPTKLGERLFAEASDMLCV